MMPHLVIIEENLNVQGEKKKEKEILSTLNLQKKKLLDFSRSVNYLSIERLRDKGKKCEISNSTLVSTTVGISNFNKKLLEHLTPDKKMENETGEKSPDRYVEEGIMKNIILNAMIIRDEQNEF
jgi:hypothetical protein